MAGLCQGLAQRRKGAKTGLAGELILCELIDVGWLAIVLSKRRRAEETEINHQAGFAPLRSLRENNHSAGVEISRVGLGLPRKYIAQRRKGAKNWLRFARLETFVLRAAGRLCAFALSARE